MTESKEPGTGSAELEPKSIAQQKSTMKFVRKIFFQFVLGTLFFATSVPRGLCASVVKPFSDLRLLVSGLCAVVVTLCSLLVAPCSSANAQQPANIHRIGFLGASSASA